MRIETFERDLTIIGGLLILTPLIVILLSEVFNNSLIFLAVPLLTILSILLILTVDRDLDSMMKILVNYNPSLVRSYEKFKNRLLRIYESLNEDEKILFKYSLCNRLRDDRIDTGIGNILDLSLDIGRRNISDIRLIENFRKIIVSEMRRLVYRFSTLLMVCMLSLGVLAPLLYVILSKELVGTVNMLPLVACIVPTLVIYFYLCLRICRRIEHIGLDRTLIKIRRNCLGCFLLSLLTCILITLFF